jgi:hypothetical protein
MTTQITPAIQMPLFMTVSPFGEILREKKAYQAKCYSDSNTFIREETM